MGPETNIHSILALEKQIGEGKGDIIKLKRARNSLLNVSTRVPPEILGHIFVCSLTREAVQSLYPRYFGGLQKGSYNFLLVCHHWSEVASRTPELWSFWGNTFQDWKRQHYRSGAAPLDLVLDGDKCDPGVFFDESLQDAVRSRVMQNIIRQVHLQSNDSNTLTSIISSLTPADEGSQNGNIESIIWRGWGIHSVDVSKFFALSLLSKLRFLKLSGNFRISSWNHLASRTTLLTTLSLQILESPPSPTPTPTVPQLLSILSSNPDLRELSLSDAALPNDADGSTLQVPLRGLRTLTLSGKTRHLLGLLRRLTLPVTLDNIHLTGFDSTVEEISQTLVPYMRDYFQRDVRFQDALGISSLFSPLSISISVNAVCGQTAELARKPPFSTFTIMPVDPPPPDTLCQLFINVITSTPREHVVLFDTNLDIELPEELFSMMPGIETMCASDVVLSKGFLQPNPDGPHADRKLFPSLRSLYLEDIDLDDNDWGHLIAYLTHQTSGSQTISLEVLGDSPYMSPEVVNQVKSLVEEFTYYQDPEEALSSCGCSTHGEGE